MAILGVILLVIGLILFLNYRGQKQKLFSVKTARSVTAAELAEMAGAVAAEIGGGSWRDYVKLWGEITAESPLYSEHKQEPCVYFESLVSREYETKNKEGEREKKSERISQNRQRIAFWLHDRTGKVKVDPEGAAIEAIAIMDEFREERSGETLGYRYSESVLPVSREVLVVGAVSDLTGEVMIGQPVRSEHKFIISLKNEEMLASMTSRSVKNIFYSMIACLVLGGICLIISLW